MAEVKTISVSINTDADTANLERLTGELRRVKDELKDVEKARKDNTITEKQANAETARLTLEQKKARKELSQTQKSILDQDKALNSATGSYDELVAANAVLNKELRELPNGFDKSNKAAADLKEQIFANTERLKDFDKEINRNFRNVGNYAEALIETERELKQQKATLEANTRALQIAARQTDKNSKEQNQIQQELSQTQKEYKEVTSQLDKFNDNIKESNSAIGSAAQALSGLGGSFGVAGKALEDINSKLEAGGSKLSVVGGALKSALGPVAIAATVALAGKAFFDLQQRIEGARKEVRKLTDATGENLDQITAATQATADTFDKDFNEVLRAANALAKQTGITFDESFDIINKGFVAGADANGDFLDQLTEYPAQFEAVGLSAQESVAIISQSVKEGVFSDKGIDTIKEAGLRLRELPKSTREALDGIGLSSTEIEKALKSGERSIFEVIQQVSKQLDTLPPQSAEVGTAIADIFGGAGEDAGLAYIKTLGDIETDLDKVIEGSSEFQQNQLELVRVNTELEKVLNDALGGADGTLDAINLSARKLLLEGLQGAVNGVVSFINSFRELQNESTAFRIGINLFKEAFVTNFRVISNAIGLVKDSLVSLGSIFASALRGDFDAIPGIIEQGLLNHANRIKTFGEETAKGFTDAYQDALDPKELLEPIDLTSDFTFSGSKSGKAYGVGFVDAAGKSIGAGLEGISEDEAKKAQEGLKKILSDFVKKIEQEQEIDAILGEEVIFDEEEIDQASERVLAGVIRDFKATRDGQLALLRSSLEAEEITKREFKEREEVINNQFDAVSRAATEKLLNDRLAKIEAFREVSNTVFTAISNFRQAQENRELAAAEGNEQKQAAIRKRFGKQKQAQASIEAVIQGALAIATTIAQLGGVGAITPPGAALIALTAATTATQVALIQSQKFAKGGLLQGASHADGGIPIAVGGSRVVEAEGGEAIINKRSTEMFSPLLSAINQAGGGVAFGDGGRLPAIAQQGTIVPNFAPPTSTQQIIQQGGTNDLIQGLRGVIAEEVQAIQVVNVATSTAAIANTVQNTEADATFG